MRLFRSSIYALVLSCASMLGAPMISIAETPADDTKVGNTSPVSIVDLIETDRSLLAHFSAFTGILFVISNGVDKDSCDILDEIYNPVTDDAWTLVDRKLAKLWHQTHQKAYRLWTNTRSLEKVIKRLRSSVDQLPVDQVHTLANAYSPIIKRLDHPKNIHSHIPASWSPTFKEAMSRLRDHKRTHDQLSTNLDILAEQRTHIGSSFGIKIQRTTLEREMQTYLKLVANHYASSASARTAAAIAPESVPSFIRMIASDIAGNHVDEMINPLIDVGVSHVVASHSSPIPTERLAYIGYMKSHGKLFDLTDLQGSTSYSLGAPVCDDQSLHDYMQRLAKKEFSIVMDGVKTGSYGIAKKFALKPYIVKPLLSNFGLNTDMYDRPRSDKFHSRILEKLVLDLASKTLKEAVFFIHDGIRYYILPEEAPLEKVGIAIKDGVYHHVLAEKAPSQPWDSLLEIPYENLENNPELVLGECLEMSAHSYTNAAKKTMSWIVEKTGDSLNDFVVKSIFSAVIGHTDHFFGTNIQYAGSKKTDGIMLPEDENNHIWDDDELYIGVKIGQHISKRVVNKLTRTAYSQVTSLLGAKENTLEGVTILDGQHYAVYSVK